jgi:hypothetical protein
MNWEDVYWIHLAGVSVQWRISVNQVTELCMWGGFLISFP